MKTFSQFILEADSSASDASSAISRSGSGEGTSGAKGPWYKFKKRRLPIEFKKKEREVTEPGEEPNKDTVDTPRDRQPAPYRQVNKTATQKPSQERPSLPPGKERPALPSSRDSMVAKRTASAQQPPQHKQISARPASTAMAGSRQRPAIRPGTQQRQLPSGQSPITKRDTSTPDRRPNIQGVRVRDVTQRPKALPSGQKQLSSAPQKRLNPAQQRQLPPARS